MKSKLLIVVLVVVTSVAADQITKLWAEATLASPRYPDHTVELVVEADDDGKTLEEMLTEELTWTSSADLEVIAGAGDSPGYVLRDGRRLRPDTVVLEGDALELQLKTATIIDGFWDHHYARNPGAAFSFMADAPETVRRSFFVVMSLLAVVLMGWFLIRAHPTQRRLTWALSLVIGGAVGNLIDRIAYGYVIDFVAWHVGDAYWPTFNIADAVICVGIGMLALEMFFAPVPGDEPEPEAEDDGDAEHKKVAASATPAATPDPPEA